MKKTIIESLNTINYLTDIGINKNLERISLIEDIIRKSLPITQNDLLNESIIKEIKKELVEENPSKENIRQNLNVLVEGPFKFNNSIESQIENYYSDIGFKPKVIPNKKKLDLGEDDFNTFLLGNYDESRVPKLVKLATVFKKRKKKKNTEIDNKSTKHHEKSEYSNLKQQANITKTEQMNIASDDRLESKIPKKAVKTNPITKKTKSINNKKKHLINPNYMDIAKTYNFSFTRGDKAIRNVAEKYNITNNIAKQYVYKSKDYKPINYSKSLLTSVNKNELANIIDIYLNSKTNNIAIKEIQNKIGIKINSTGSLYQMIDYGQKKLNINNKIRKRALKNNYLKNEKVNHILTMYI